MHPFWRFVFLFLQSSLWLLGVACLPVRGATDFPRDPILRLNTQGHFGMIRSIDVDEQDQWLISGSDDKTVKVWRASDGVLKLTIHPPIGADPLGRIYSVAISPDGDQIAAGGWTGPRQGTNMIYVFNRSSGALQYKITKLPNVIWHLDYSNDGQRLVATLGKKNGIRVYDTSDYSEVFKDAEYGMRSHSADFGPDGRLVTSSYFGKIRLYDADYELLKMVDAPGGRGAGDVIFSPDGKRIAVAYSDRMRVDIFEAESLTLLKTLKTGPAGNGGKSTAAWSYDGLDLFTSGSQDRDGARIIERRFGAKTDVLTKLPATAGDVMSLRPLKDRGLVVGSRHLLARLSEDGSDVWRHSPPGINFRGQLHADGIRVSPTGDRVAFKLADGEENVLVFSVPELELSPISGTETMNANDSPLSGLELPDEGPRPQLKVSDWEDGKRPKINGQRVRLEAGDISRSRSLAIASDAKRLVLETDFRLRAFAPEIGQDWGDFEQIWEHNAPGPAWALNITRDGRYLVAGYGDGTLRWHRMDNGLEVLALNVARTEDEARYRWVLWTPEGYYQASAAGEDLIGWHVNRGPKQTADFFPISRFRERFYRPDVIARVLHVGDPAESVRLADELLQDQGVKTGRASGGIEDALPPVVKVITPKGLLEVTDPEVHLIFTVRSDEPIQRIEYRINSRPIIPEEQSMELGEDLSVGEARVKIPPEDSVVEVLATNVHGTGKPGSVELPWGGGTDTGGLVPTLYVLSIGIDKYQSLNTDIDADFQLQYAAKDAREFSAALQAQEGSLYDRVHLIDLLENERATRSNITTGLHRLQKQTKPKDVAVLFAAGHGVRDELGEYFFVPVDGKIDALTLTALTGTDFKKYLRRISGKTIVFLDTCYSGKLDPGRTTSSLPDMARLANELAEADGGIVVFASSTGKQKSREYPAGENGAFTEALLEVLEGKAPRKEIYKDNVLYISEINTHLSERVPIFADPHAQHPIMRKPEAIKNLRIFYSVQHPSP